MDVKDLKMVLFNSTQGCSLSQEKVLPCVNYNMIMLQHEIWVGGKVLEDEDGCDIILVVGG